MTNNDDLLQKKSQNTEIRGLRKTAGIDSKQAIVFVWHADNVNFTYVNIP